MPFKVIIAGTRDFNDYDMLKEKCERILSNKTDIEVISGTARGADQLGERYASENNYPIHRYPADWDKHGRMAGYIRNEEMAKNADALIAFWDGSSKGTRHMINIATGYGLQVRVVPF